MDCAARQQRPGPIFPASTLTLNLQFSLPFYIDLKAILRLRRAVMVSLAIAFRTQ